MYDEKMEVELEEINNNIFKFFDIKIIIEDY